MAGLASAAPAQFTGRDLPQIPSANQPTATFNLRQLGVVTGSAPLRITSAVLFWGDAPTERIGVSVNGVCVTLTNPGIVPSPNDQFRLRITVENGQLPAVTSDVPLTDGLAPPLQAPCDDPNTLIARINVVEQPINDNDGEPGEPVAFTGTASDTDGDTLRVQWLVNSVPVAGATTLTETLTLVDGTNRVTLQVTDETNQVVNDTVSVSVTPPQPPRQPPIANAGPSQDINDTNAIPGESVSLDGSASSDPDGSIVSYVWTDSLGQEIPNGANPTLTLIDGVHTITLTVTDNSQLTATSTVQIRVGPPTNPIASAEVAPSASVVEGQPVELNGSDSSDPDGQILSYAWSLGDAALGNTETVTNVRLPVGTHDIVLVVTDNVGLQGRDTVRVVVTAAPQVPIANAGESRTIEDGDQLPGENVELDGSASTDPDGGSITSYAWYIGDEQIGETATFERHLDDGTTTVRLVVTDDDEQMDEATIEITVTPPNTPDPQPPTANAGEAQNFRDTDGVAGERVTLSGTASDPEGGPLTYRWLLGDTELGDTLELQNVLIPNDGPNTITLEVTDDTELTATATVVITIGPPRAPIADAGEPQTVASGALVTLNGTASTDPDGGDIEEYEWLIGERILTGATVDTQLPDGVNTVTLRVTDDSGLQATDTVQITVSAAAQAPLADAGADQNLADADGLPGELVTFSATQSDGPIATYEWSLGNTLLGTGATLQARVPDGVNVVSLLVRDSAGLTATDSVQITVAAPVLPIVDAGLARTIEDTDLQPGESVQLTGSATTNVGTITQYQWFLGDNLLGSGASITARIPDGVNVVTLRATNSINAVGSASAQITVTAGVRTVLANIPGLTPNERRLAEKLDQACNTVLDAPTTTVEGDGPTIAAKRRAPTAAEVSDFTQKCRGLLISRDNVALADAMGALLGDDFAVARTQTLLFANTQYASVMDRLTALRGGAKGLSLAGLNIVVDGEMIPLAELQDLAKQLFGGGASSDADGLWSDKWGLWARGNYSFGSKDEDSLSPSFDADQYALLAGLDYRLSQSAVIGAALAYGNSTIEFNPSGEGSLDTQSWAISLYGSLYAKKNFYFDAIMNVADSGYEAERNITYVDGFGLVSTDASGDTGGLTLSGGVSVGYDFLIGGLTISPTLGAFYIDAQIDEFTESGAGGLNLIYDEQKFKSLTGNLGLRMTFAWNLPWGVLLPHVRADFVREFEDDVDVFGIRFAADPNAASTPPILVETENQDTSYWRFAAGFSAQFRHGISGYVEYQRLESFQFISFQDVSLGLRFQRTF